MVSAARGNVERDMVEDVSRAVEEQERHSLKGNLGELVVQELIVQGRDASRWEYVDESETDLLRDGSLKLDVKTRDLAHSQGHLLCRRRYVHLNCGGALDMEDDRRCVRCGQREVTYYYREELKSDMYLRGCHRKINTPLSREWQVGYDRHVPAESSFGRRAIQPCGHDSAGAV
jgi:hypothetical protein